jgi:hypothetical protein
MNGWSLAKSLNFRFDFSECLLRNGCNCAFRWLCNPLSRIRTSEITFGLMPHNNIRLAKVFPKSNRV